VSAFLNADSKESPKIKIGKSKTIQYLIIYPFYSTINIQAVPIVKNTIVFTSVIIPPTL
jgi:hypothetical protein